MHGNILWTFRFGGKKRVFEFISSHFFPAGFALGSVEGRVGIQYVNAQNPKDNFTFKCHRSTQAANGFQVRCCHFVSDVTCFALTETRYKILLFGLKFWAKQRAQYSYFILVFQR